jgi:hypothetical protein
LASRAGSNPQDAIRREQFSGPSEFFDRLDRNRDGLLTSNDFDWSPQNRPDRLPLARRPTVFVKFASRLLCGQLGSVYEGPKVGQTAPDFTLAAPDSGQEIKLSEFGAGRPVVLIFGSFT